MKIRWSSSTTPPPKIPIGSQASRFAGSLKNDMIVGPLAGGRGVSEFITELSPTFNATNITRPKSNPIPRCFDHLSPRSPSALNPSPSRRSSRKIAARTMILLRTMRQTNSEKCAGNGASGLLRNDLVDPVEDDRAQRDAQRSTL